MPNHVYTKLIVTGDSPALKRLQEAVKGEDSAFSCNAILPMPAELGTVGSPVQIVEEQGYPAEVERARQLSIRAKCSVGLPITRAMSNGYLEKYGENNWYDWRNRHWGTKWDVYEVAEWDQNGRSISIAWQSAWSPVSPVIAELSRRFPGLTFTLKFADENGCFLGYESFGKGKVVDQGQVDWDSDAGIELRKEIGCYDPEDEEEDEEEGEGDEHQDDWRAFSQMPFTPG